MSEQPQASAYYRPRSLGEALERLGEGARIVAGGTDVYPALGDRAMRGAVLDITNIDDLKGVSETGEGWRIGAAATWSELLAAKLPPAFDGLKAAAREVGSIQIQNAASVAGNLCNASPAADGVPALMSLGAEVEIAGPNGARRLAVEEFILGPRKTALAPGELLSAIWVPPHDARARGGFEKLGARAYLVISIAMVAAVVTPDAQGRVASARVAVGACSPVARRLPELENALVGAEMSATALAESVKPDHLAPLSPIDDVRASAEYRMGAALELTQRVLADCVEGK